MPEQLMRAMAAEAEAARNARAKVILKMMALVALMSVFMRAMASKAGCSLLL